MRKIIYIFMLGLLVVGCKGNKNAQQGEETATVEVPTFDADSALALCQAQCDFGPRIMNSTAHDDCGKWIAAKFRVYGCEVTEQQATLYGYDSTELRSTNIIASLYPELTTRILVCAHWDSRPWADNDPDKANWDKPVMAANDGASGVAVMLEMARVMKGDTALNVGVDFICFDAEDWGMPQWINAAGRTDSWALGAQYWAQNPHKAGYEARYGILLDMVGGEGAHFYKEGISQKYASKVVDKVWAAAKTAGFGSFFPDSDGGYVTDDHVPVNETLHIPTIDILPHYPDCQQSSFGPTWHTVNDTMEHIDKNTLRAVGQAVLQVIYSE